MSRSLLLLLMVVLLSAFYSISPLYGSPDFSDDFESGTLDNWTNGGRQLGFNTADVVLFNGSLSGHLQHSSYSEITMYKDFQFDVFALNDKFYFDLAVDVYSSLSNVPSNYYGWAGVSFIFLNMNSEKIGAVHYGAATTDYPFTVWDSSDSENANEISEGVMNHYEISIAEMLSQITVDQSQIALIRMEGKTYSSTYPSPYVSTELWIDNVKIAPILSPDFNEDGKADILWRNTSTGKNSVWYMDGASKSGSASLPSVSDTNWKIVGIEDFNADGHPDILWRNTSTGKNAVYYMDGVTRTGSVSLSSVSDTTWAIVGTPDFNADGKPDILWRNSTTGKNSVWFMDGVTRTGSASLSTLSDTTWTIVGTADFNADGKPDILWRNTSSGKNAVWYMNGVAKTGSVSLSSVSDTTWTIVGTPDLNSDGKPDILWRNTTTGKNSVWFMNGVTRTSSASLPSVSDTNWTIVP